MEVAAKILVVGGILNIALSFAFGYVLAAVLLRRPETPGGFLLQTHRVTLWQGFMLLGLAFAIGLSKLPSSLEILAAALLLAGSAFQAASTLVNWLRGVENQFVGRPIGLKLAAVNTVLGSLGVAIVLVGVVRGL